ncbi:hypothetical protein [Marmoricola sp. RAF53]|uniref:hypothetical protein n=1 Tax=Marmoricola sp. RAF53 TaxID=3233059 RepID=UPI003F9B7F34
MSDRSPLKTLLRSGWVPAAVVVGLTAVLLNVAAEVAFRDIALFGAYLVGWLVLPGTLIWRFVGRRLGPRPLAEDLAVGALVGYVVEFPVYLACLAVGAPRLYLAWPLVMLLVTLTSAGGRRLWRPTRMPMPAWWSWGVAALMAPTVIWFARHTWWPAPQTDESLRRAYVDEPFHLSLATGLKHFFPQRVTYVADTPLDYHWLSHLHVAAASWVSGVEPIVLLRTMTLPALFLFVVLGLAHVAVRLTGARWTGLVAAGAILIAPIDFSGWSNGGGERLLASRLIASPSAGFVNAALLLGLLLCLEILRGRLRDWPVWVLAGLSMVAMIGAKSTSLPTLLAGLVAAAVLTSCLQRRVDKVATGLAALALITFYGGKTFFFGPGNHGLAVDPFAFTSQHGDLPRWAAAIAALSFLGYLSTGAGTLALLARAGWRRADHVFLVVTCLAGLGAGLTFHQSSSSEYYFVYVVFLPILLGGVLGLHHLVHDLPGRLVLRVGATAFVAGCVVTLVVIGLDLTSLAPELDDSSSAGVFVLRWFVVPMLVTLALCGLVAWGVLRGWRSRLGATPVSALVLPVLVLTLAGAGLAPTVRTLPDVVTDVRGTEDLGKGSTLIGRGGIQAARWLRDHTAVDTVVATNAHCQWVNTPTCVPRAFWMAGYGERQFLVEGWSYVSRSSVGLPAPADENTTTGPFWDPKRLALNDAAFLHPGPETLGALRDKYGVSWLLVDRRFPVDIDGLKEHATRRFRSGVYTVFELR